MNILLVEDDKTIAEGLRYSLEQEGYQVTIAESLKEAYFYLNGTDFEIALLDLTLPDGSGYDICKYIKDNKNIPVIFLTARDDEVNVVMGLDMGADDYITKPFRIRELMSRIKSVLRRYQNGNGDKGESTHFSFEDIRVLPEEAKVYKGESEVTLTALEYKLLLLFANNQGQVLTRNQLLQNIWDVSGDFVNDNTLTVYIKRLREKLENDPQNPEIIKTVRGIGYRI